MPGFGLEQGIKEESTDLEAIQLAGFGPLRGHKLNLELGARAQAHP